MLFIFNIRDTLQPDENAIHFYKGFESQNGVCMINDWGAPDNDDNQTITTPDSDDNQTIAIPDSDVVIECQSQCQPGFISEAEAGKLY